VIELVTGVTARYQVLSQPDQGTFVVLDPFGGRPFTIRPNQVAQVVASWSIREVMCAIQQHVQERETQ